MYPTVVDVFDGKQNIVSGWIFFKSINLDNDWEKISEDLLAFAKMAD
jgi:hypothetical protein